MLPATTFLEHYDLNRSYGGHAMLLVKPVIEPVGESRPNHEVFGELEVRLGLSDGADRGRDRGAVPRRARGCPATPARSCSPTASALPPGGDRPIQFVDVFPLTADGKVHLFPADVPTLAPGGLYSYQAGSRHRRSPAGADLAGQRADDQLDARRAADAPRACCTCTRRTPPRAASPTATPVRVFNALGEVHCLVEVTDADPRQARSASPRACGGAARSTSRPPTRSRPTTLTDLGGGACFNDARVEVTRILEASWEGKPLALFVPTDDKLPVR